MFLITLIYLYIHTYINSMVYRVHFLNQHPYFSAKQSHLTQQLDAIRAELSSVQRRHTETCAELATAHINLSEAQCAQRDLSEKLRTAKQEVQSLRSKYKDALIELNKYRKSGGMLIIYGIYIYCVLLCIRFDSSKCIIFT